MVWCVVWRWTWLATVCFKELLLPCISFLGFQSPPVWWTLWWTAVVWCDVEWCGVVVNLKS